MISAPAAPPSVAGGGSTPGGGADQDTRRRRRRLKNRNYRRNRARRSHTTIVSWNAEGLRSKISELGGWLSAEKVDIVAVQEAQLPKTVPTIPGFQPPVVVRRARGRTTGAAVVKGGDVAVYVRAGLHFAPLTGRHLAAADDSTELCGVRLFGPQTLDVWNIYRPPIRATNDQRVDRFDPRYLPSDDNSILVGDVNGHHPRWDRSCEIADAVGDRIAEWLDEKDWITLNSCEPTFASYRSGGQTAPDLAACSRTLSRRAQWSLGPDLGSDHLPVRVEVRAATAPPRRVRKTRWSFRKANWPAFQAECERELTPKEGEDPPPRTVQEQADRLEKIILAAARRHIPRGARADPRPWALDPELEEAVRERRSARSALRSDDPASRDRWIAAKKAAAEIEQRIRRDRFREFVTSTLNKPASLGRVSKLLKKWERSNDDQHRDGQAMEVAGKTITSDRAKADAFVREYAGVSKQVRVPRLDRAARHKLASQDMRRCRECDDTRRGTCAPFSRAELERELGRLQAKKAPGPDDLTNEMLRQLGPAARTALLVLINSSWLTGEVPRQWRAAKVVPIPKTGKDKKLVSSYRPIALTSHLGKLAERLIKARLCFLAESRGLIPPEQVGFRPGRSVEDNIGRLVQEVQDGWQRPKARGRTTAESAQKYVLVAYDFARAYDVVDHRLLRVRLLELGLPHCMVTWVWQWLRDRRVRVELNGTYSSERVFRAGLPQGSVLSPPLFLLWAAPLVSALRQIPGCSPYMYADDTATLCAGPDITTARERAQTAADTLVSWARASKMVVSGPKTQVLVLSQWARDAVGLTIKVGGATVEAKETLNLLGVTLDRLLHFGPHCKKLKQRSRPRIEHLRRLTGREWGLQEQQLRVVANGYVRGSLEHAAAAWLPATPPTHVEVLERELRAAARVVTGCTRSTPVLALMAEAGIIPMSARRTSLAARLLTKARARSEEDPLRQVADAEVRSRLSSVRGWRSVGTEACREAGVEAPVEPVLAPKIPPWTETASITFDLDVGDRLPQGTSAERRRQVATLHLGSLPQCATWVWTDGSAEGGVKNGGSGALIEWPDGTSAEVRAPAGSVCSSYRAELIALRAAIDHLLKNPAHEQDPVIFCTDSQAALASLRGGPAEQRTALCAEVWEALISLATGGRRIHLQWVPSHCGIPGNEHADTLAGEAAALPQEEAPLDTRTVFRAVARVARARTAQQRPAGWYQTLMEGTWPPPVSGVDRYSAVDVHQLRAGHWAGSTQYLHRIGRAPSPECPGCDSQSCRAAFCTMCREEADTPHHILLRCPALMTTRFRITGFIHPTMAEARSSTYVAALGAAARRLQGREASRR